MLKTVNQLNWIPYEHFCMDYHRKHFNQTTWHWTHIPETVLEASGFIHDYNALRLKRKERFNEEGTYYNIAREYGLDGISQEIIDGDEVYNGIQCKLWKKRLTAGHLGTFYQALYMRMIPKNSKSKGYLYHFGPLHIELRDDFKNAKKNFIATKLPFDGNEIFGDVNNESGYIPYPFQQLIIDKLDQGWDGRGLVISPCGTGKTLIACKHVQNMHYKKIFIFTPLRIQVKQFMDRISAFLPTYKKLIVDCDDDATRDIKDVLDVLNGDCIIASTYKSAEDIISQLCPKIKVIDDDEVYYEYQVKGDFSDSLLIVDEVHNLINNDNLIEIIKGFPKVLLMTATPPSQIEEIIDCEILYNYPMRDAIKEGYICDYEIYLPLLEDDVLPDELMGLEYDLCKKALFLINGMLKTGSRRCITYLPSIEECGNFIEILNEVMKNYYAMQLWTGIITSDTNQNNRTQILEEFKTDNIDIIKVIASVRILDEAIDIIKCDSTFITKVGDYTSDIKTLQRMCRANRKDKNNPNKKAVCFMWATDLDKCVSAMSILKENDIEFHTKIRYMNSNYDKNNNLDTIEIINTKNEQLVEYINVKCLSPSEMWEYKKNKLFEETNKHKTVPIRRTKLGNWLSFQKKKIKSIDDDLYKKLSQNIYVKYNLDQFLNNKENKSTFEKSINELFEDSDKNKRVPIQTTKLGNWLSFQKSKITSIDDDLYKTLSQNIYVKENLNQYLNKKENKLTYDESMNKLFEDSDKNKQVPISTTKIGKWLNTQKNKIKSIDDDLYKTLSQNIFVKDSLDQYLNNKENKSTFEESMNKLFENSDKNKMVPIRRTKLGQWLQRQKKKIKSVDSDIYKTLSQNIFVKDNLDQYLNSKENKSTFEESINKLFEDSDQNKMVPTDKTKIGRWLSNNKKKINTIDDDLYKILSQNIFVKEKLDKYLNNKEKNKFEESMNKLFKDSDKNKRVPKSRSKLGTWLNDQKQKIKSIDSDVYKKLAVNSYVKDSLDQFLNKKQLKM